MHSFDAFATLDHLGDAFFAVDAEWRFTFVNAQAARQWDRSAQSLIGQNMWEQFPGLLGSPFERVYREAARDRTTANFKSYSTATSRWYDVRVFPTDGGLAAFYHDATELKIAEDELARVSAESDRERRMYQTVLSNSGDLHYVVDVDGRFMFANAPLLQLYQRTMEEMEGHTFQEMGRSDEVTHLFDEQVLQVVTTGKPVRHETPFQKGFGGRTYEYILMPVFDADGDVEAVAGSSRDTTDRRANELAIRQEARRKDEFIATLAHELRNPLAPIRNALEVARLAKGNDVAVEYAHGVMDRQMTHMVRLIDDLLDLSRLSLGRIELKRHTFDLSSVLETAVETSRPHILQSELELTVQLPTDVLCVDADSTRLVQVFSNLLTNSAKFTPHRGRVMLTAVREHDWAVVRVTDSGVGMNPEMLAHAFDSFTQEGDALNRTEGGLGIGLTLVKGLVALHGGTVEARSDGKGLGSEFTVRLPLSKEPHSPEAQKARRQTSTATNWHRILVVDDNKDSATSLSMMLNFMGHDTRTANDGLRGLEVAETFRPDVCLLDIGMPNLNGFELAERLRAEPWGTDILLIALSGWGQEHDKERSSEAGFDLHLVKPIDPATLGAVLEARRPTPRAESGRPTS
ncbi:MAG: PAS domain-containing protein [Gemmatimonas sp.]